MDYKKKFEELGFYRKVCKKCGKVFYTKNKDDNICQDCRTYEFLERDIKIKKNLDVNEIRETFLNYWNKKVPIKHEIIEPYPVVARWREDVYLTGASIYDFQPTGGFKPNKPILVPANPLTISQPCIRETDLESVGITGRHMASFEMMAHHAFNSDKEFYYWINETIEWSFNLFTKEFGIDESELQYIESVWEGGGNRGFSFEVFAGGIEIATLVFMDEYFDEKESKYKKMNYKIIDTGYGLERIAWLSSKKPSGYLVLYEDIIKKFFNVDYEEVKLLHIAARDVGFSDNHNYKKLIENYSKKLGINYEEARKKAFYYKSLFSLFDFSRAIVLLLSDFTVPSNKEEGYTVRLLIRRSYDYAKFLGLSKEDYFDVIYYQIAKWYKVWRKLKENRIYIIDVLEKEINKYEESIEKGKKKIKKFIRKGSISLDDIVKLYDTYGISPEFLVKEGIISEIPEKFEDKLLEIHKSTKKIEEKIKISLPDNIVKTEKEYYKDPYKRFDFSEIIYKTKDFIVLNKTIFYPEGGGAKGDKGIIDRYEIVDTQEVNGVIIHKIGKEYKYKGVILVDFNNVLFRGGFRKIKEVFNSIDKIKDSMKLEYDLKDEEIGKIVEESVSKGYFNDKLYRTLKKLKEKGFYIVLFTENIHKEAKRRFIEKIDKENVFSEILFVRKRNIRILEDYKEKLEKIKEVSPRIIIIDDNLYSNSLKNALEALGNSLGIYLQLIPYKFEENPDKILDVIKPDKIFIAIDWKRRYRIMRTHTVTHILLRTLKFVLGNHIWQTGAEKNEEFGRLDVRHYYKPSEEEIKLIEDIVNGVISEGLNVKEKIVSKVEAEKKYGFEIYQGGVVYKEKIRLIEIEGFDIQACGGLHVKNTKEVGLFKIEKVESIADGVIRFYYRVFDGIIDKLYEYEKILRELEKILRTPYKDLGKSISRIFNEWKKLKEENKKLMEELIKEKLKNNHYVKVSYDDVGLFKKIINDYKNEKDKIIIEGEKVIVVYPKEVLKELNFEYKIIKEDKDIVFLVK